MNWVRSELKSEARSALSKGYWKAVLVAFILAIISGSGASVGSAQSSFSTSLDNYNGYESYGASYNELYGLDVLNDFTPQQIGQIIAVASGIIVVALLVSLAINLFIFGPLNVGCARYSELAIKRPTELNLSRGFTPNYWNIVKSMFIRTLFTALWALLYAVVYLILTGIFVGVMIASDASRGVIVFLMFLLFLIGVAGAVLLALKLYEYRMIPYILASDPNMERREAFRIAKEMVNGERLQILLLDLSFIGWDLLAVLTCGLLFIFYINPYTMLTEAALFHKLCEKVGFTVDMNGLFVSPTGGNMMGGSYNDSGYAGGYNNGNFNKDGQGNSGYGNGGYDSSGVNPGDQGGSGYNIADQHSSGYSNAGGYGGSGYSNAGGYGGSGYNNAGGYGGSGYNNNDNYGGSGYNNAGSYGSSSYDNGSAGYGRQDSNYYNGSPADVEHEYKGSGNTGNDSHNTGSSYDEYDYTVGYKHPASGHEDHPKKDQDFDNIDFT